VGSDGLFIPAAALDKLRFLKNGVTLAVYLHIKAKETAGVLEASTSLVAAELGTSRGSVSKALDALHAANLVEVDYGLNRHSPTRIKLTDDDADDLLVGFAVESVDNLGEECVSPDNGCPPTNATALIEEWNKHFEPPASALPSNVRAADAARHAVAKSGRENGQATAYLVGAIRNYAAVLNSHDHIFSIRFGFAEFFDGQYVKFLDESDPLTRFRNFDSAPKGGPARRSLLHDDRCPECQGKGYVIEDGVDADGHEYAQPVTCPNPKCVNGRIPRED